MRKTLLCMLLAFGMMGFAQLALADNFSTAMAVVDSGVFRGPDDPGGADAALPSDYSTNNPASIASPASSADGDKIKVNASVVYNWLNFTRGPSVNVLTESVSAKLPVGVLQLNVTQGESGSPDHTLMGVDADVALQSISILYGLKVGENLLVQGDKLYLGISGSPYSHSKLVFSVPGMDLLESKSDGYAVGGGFQYMLNEKLRVGGYYSYSSSNDHQFDFTTGSSERSRSNLHQARLGASYKLNDRLFFAGELQYLNIEGTEKLQPFVGAELAIVKDAVFLTAGYASHGPSVGLGVYGKNIGFAASYTYDLVQETKPFLGRTDLVTAMIYVSL